jgi:hypothetical protein
MTRILAGTESGSSTAAPDHAVTQGTILLFDLKRTKSTWLEDGVDYCI